ncbi:hypothetical protein PUN28_006084 [Cardiocondyla obscurior]|uniref:Uncharacterized protein n=1 Tax=Cardiocondyla obscurior TaxID=286306 RepID=A0AAW2G769_9HYME
MTLSEPILGAWVRMWCLPATLRDFPSQLPEPVGSKAPAFAGDAKLSLLVRKANMDVSLPCNAQGHPPPVSR